MITATDRAESAASERFAAPADEDEVLRTAAALEANGFTVLRARMRRRPGASSWT